MEIIAIYASDKNHGIGKGNTLPWKSKQEMKFFKETTEHNVVIMGSKTFLSIGKPLKNRINLVITKNPNNKKISDILEVFEKEKLVTKEKTILRFFESLESAIKYANRHLKENAQVATDYLFDNPEMKIFIIGGKSIYEQAAPFATKFLHSQFKEAFDCDVFFNHLDCPFFKFENDKEKGSYQYALNSSEDKGDFVVSEYLRYKVTVPK